MDGVGFFILLGGIMGGSYFIIVMMIINNDWVMDLVGGSFMGGLSGIVMVVEFLYGNGEKMFRESINSSSIMGGSVRKWLSLLRLGKKSSKDNVK